jgi:hypothetical protein
MLDYNKYEETFNCFVNYKSLSKFIGEKLYLSEGGLPFIDLPCGSGKLLSEMTQLNMNLVGVDLSEYQTKKAQSVAGSKAEIFTANCFDIKKIINKFDAVIIHCGNSFIQNFSPLEQSKLLEYFLSFDNVGKVIVEYQNIDYFSNYKENTWYSRNVNENLEVKSSHSYISDGKKVDFIFKHKNGQPQHHNIVLYDFNVDSHDILNSYDYKNYPATYRDYNGEDYSHIILEVTNARKKES